MPLTLKPATGSGQMTLISVAGTTTSDTLTLPAKTGNIITSADTGTVTQTMLGTNVAGNGPAFSAYLGTTQSITVSTWTKLQLNSEDFDTNNNFDSTTNYRFTPTVAGYYQINGAFFGQGTTATSVYSAIYKNGSAYQGGSIAAANGGVNGLSVVSAVIQFNGSTDYIELWAYINAASGGSAQAPSTFLITRLSGFLARSA